MVARLPGEPILGGKDVLHHALDRYQALAILGDDVQVVAAFQNIAPDLLTSDNDLECEVLVTGSSKAARLEAIKLVEAAGMVGWDAGPIENAAVVEGLTSILININKQYGSTHAGIKITGATREA